MREWERKFVLVLDSRLVRNALQKSSRPTAKDRSEYPSRFVLSSTCTQIFAIKILLLFSQIAHYKVPRYVTFVQGYPLTITGKVSVIMRYGKYESRCTPPLLLKINNSDDSFSLEKVISVSI